jgi:nucleoside 2-deoxyribosyltransferase
VLLPQDEALPFITRTKVDALGIAEHCYRQAVDCDVMIVVLDGADSDSGSSLEAGIKIAHRRAVKDGTKIIGLRTDFRASEDGRLNAMFRLLDSVVTFLSFNEDLDELCRVLNDAICAAFASGQS